MQVTLNNYPLTLPHPLSGLELIQADTALQKRKKEFVGMLLNGAMRDLSDMVSDGDTVELLTFEEDKGRYMFWHTSAHLLAMAILRHFPDAQPSIGPPIDQGFYYDFGNLTLSEDDFGKIEDEVNQIIKADFVSERIAYRDKEEALQVFGQNPYKKALIDDLEEGLSAYRHGEFVDLCRGPHIPSMGYIKAFKLLKTSGAYWRADQNNDQLTRVYAISYPSKQQLKDYLHILAEAKKRDHRTVGKKLEIFSFQSFAPGMPFFHPSGMNIWKKLMAFWHEKHLQAGYLEIKTPIMLSQSLWETSGHWDNYRENMYTSHIDDQDYAIKPMNCPGCMLYFKSGHYSYRQLPLRIAEVGHVHRHELSGALSGLFRVRSFHQDDSHLFMRQVDIESEIIRILDLAREIYGTFGLDFAIELSTRPEKSIGTDEQWEIATAGLRNALENNDIVYKLNEGDGAFYGPKIDLHIKDAIGRTWQCGTIQLDMMLPEKFDLTYDDDDGRKKRPIMLHRTIFGSIERFLGILIEHYSGRFPFWISPRQIIVIPVADRFSTLAVNVAKQFSDRGFDAHADTVAESVGKKIRNAQLLQYNYMIIIGEKEAEEHNLSIRTRNGKTFSGISFDNALATFSAELNGRTANSVYDN